MVIEPRIRGFLCLTSHPEGCAANVRAQAELAKAGPGTGLKNVLVIGSSTGFGLSSLLTSMFGYGADVLGICFEKPPADNKPASPGYYNLAEAHVMAKEAGRRLETINADAFSHEVKAQAIAALKERYGKIDMVVYSLASPKRKDPNSDTLWSSVLKPVDKLHVSKTVDLRHEVVEEITIPPASEQEVFETERVMGGDDWKMWIEALRDADLLAEGCRSVAYSYIGPQVTYPIYRSGTIGGAKEHLEATAKDLSALMAEHCKGEAWVSVNKALVTQASSAIPVVPLYISILYKVMKAAGNHEETMEQIVRLFRDHIGPGQTPTLDDKGRIRVDDWEMLPEIQAQIEELWPQASTENLEDLCEFSAFRTGFRRLFGFEVPGVDYSKPTEVMRELV
ncbi:MAG: trans-2-enoyl-CoA reductase family protein [Planctomycetota bacterium]|nr:trans-2-enoyl-CoA reductase family protein [Planctomycetota bacterium]